METYNKYFEQKLKARHSKKPELTDLGRAAIDSAVTMNQMRINDATNRALLKTDKNRASLKDIGGLRGKDYLGGYLERVTNEVKVP